MSSSSLAQLRNILLVSLLQDALSPPRYLHRGVIMPQRCRPAGIHSLPVELLTWIFILGSRFDYPYSDSPFLLKPDQEYNAAPSSNFQVIVSHVCQRWRQVALRTQSLWTTLHFREQSHIPRAKAYLARCLTSSTCLLDILVDTVAIEDHTPGITLYKEEIDTIFQIIIPHVERWRAFHLKICDNECKGAARHFLSTCGPAPNLETLQLYHFEDYRTTQNLYIATHRPPVVVFNNTIPRLKNVSLIGVNLPWAKSPYLKGLQNLELALHLDKIRPPYQWWDKMLRNSPELHTLCLHYSGPKEATDPTLVWPPEEEKVQLEWLQDLSLTDLDPGYLCNLFTRLQISRLKKLTLELPEQNFTPFLELINGPAVEDLSVDSQSSPSMKRLPSLNPSPNLTGRLLANLEVLVIRALECSIQTWFSLLLSAAALRVLEVDFTRVGSGFWKVFTKDARSFAINSGSQPQSDDYTIPTLLPRLEMFKPVGVSGKDILSALQHRYRQPPVVNRTSTERWYVKWSERRRYRDVELDSLVDAKFWPPTNASGVSIIPKVIIETYDDDEDPEEPEDDGQESSDSDGEV